MVIRRCVERLRQEATYFVDSKRAESRPETRRGGLTVATHRARRRENLNGEEMSRSRSTVGEVRSPPEWSEVVADATGTSAEEVERGFEEIDIAPPRKRPLPMTGSLYLPHTPDSVFLYWG
jgi:hypothetical protein